MSAKVYPVWIDAPSGSLFAIVHEPDADTANGAAIVMPSAGQDNRAGPQRIYLKAARRFVAEGYRVIRLDLSGTGDSATKNPKIALDSHSTKDVEAGVRWVRETLSIPNVYLVALCAGARVSIRFAAHDSSVNAMVIWSVPTLTEGDTPYLNVQGFKRAFSSKRLLTLEWWKNRWQNGPREIWQISSALAERLTESLGIKRESYFIRCMDKYLSEGRPAQFIYGSLDKILCEEFIERFPSVPRAKLGKQCFWILPEAVHTLSTVEAHDDAIAMAVDWLNERLSVRATTSQRAAMSDAARVTHAA